MSGGDKGGLVCRGAGEAQDTQDTDPSEIHVQGQRQPDMGCD